MTLIYYTYIVNIFMIKLINILKEIKVVGKRLPITKYKGTNLTYWVYDVEPPYAHLVNEPFFYLYASGTNPDHFITDTEFENILKVHGIPYIDNKDGSIYVNKIYFHETK